LLKKERIDADLRHGGRAMAQSVRLIEELFALFFGLFTDVCCLLAGLFSGCLRRVDDLPGKVVKEIQSGHRVQTT
jgi:hypothetical protein